MRKHTQNKKKERENQAQTVCPIKQITKRDDVENLVSK